jgi:uncharacterized protein YndB with AHSA1/START domain
MQTPEGTIHKLSGVFREVVRPERLVYTWTWGQGDLGGIESLVTLEFVARGEATEVRLTHEMLPGQAACELHGAGWTGSFDCLDRALSQTPEGA